jgi:hypothetical protein
MNMIFGFFPLAKDPGTIRLANASRPAAAPIAVKQAAFTNSRRFTLSTSNCFDISFQRSNPIS